MKIYGEMEVKLHIFCLLYSQEVNPEYPHKRRKGRLKSFPAHC